MYQREREIVDLDFVKREDTYNIKVGGIGGNTGTYPGTRVKDSNGNEFSVKIDDPRYLSGELKSVFSMKGCYKDKSGKMLRADRNDPRVISGELVGVVKGRIQCVDANGKYHYVDNDDEKLKSMEYVKRGFASGRKTPEETKRKISEKNKISLKGERNYMFGKHWMYNPETKEEKILSPEEIDSYINLGWKFGRKNKVESHTRELNKPLSRLGKKCITNGVVNRFLKKEEADKLVSTGEWRYGSKFFHKRSGIWLYKDDGSRTRVLPERLGEYLSNGWKKGKNF